MQVKDLLRSLPLCGIGQTCREAIRRRIIAQKSLFILQDILATLLDLVIARQIFYAEGESETRA